MDLDALVAQFRFESKDDTAFYRSSDELVISLFNDAEDEACRRKPYLYDTTTAACCAVAVTAGEGTYDLSSLVVGVHKARLEDVDGNITYLEILSRDELDRIDPDWRESADDPSFLIIDGPTMQITPVPQGAYTLMLEVQRTPLEPMASGTDSPEIATGHHRFLVLWVHHRVLSRPDPDYGNFELSELYMKRFENYFGKEQSADQVMLRRRDMLIRNDWKLE